MNRHVRDCLVYDFEDMESSLNLPDKDDRHVLAAAIQCAAQAIVTFKLKDFPRAELNKYRIEAIDPDTFVLNQLDLKPGLFCNVVRKHRMPLKKPPKSIAEYFSTMEKCGLVQSVEQLRYYAELL